MTLLKFNKGIIESTVCNAIDYYSCYEKSESKLQFCLNLNEALQHSTSDDIQMSLDDFLVIKRFF